MNDPPTPVKTTPKDAHVMASFLKEMGVDDYEPKIINQMLDFTYRYVTDILTSAQVYSTHAKKKTIDADDVRLAISIQNEMEFVTTPGRDTIVELARAKNPTPLPVIKSSTGLRLPPDRYCTIGCNFKLKSIKKTKTAHTVRLNSGNLPGNSVKSVSSVANFNKVGITSQVGAAQNKSNLTFASSSIRPITNVTRVQSPASIIKLADVSTNPTIMQSIPTTPLTVVTAPSTSNFLMPTIGTPNSTDYKLSNEPMTVKVKVEDDDYDMES